MRFLGKRPERRYCGEVVSDYGDRPEGVRVKHLAFGNSLKVYDKGGSILRIETTINQPGAFRSYRASQREPDGKRYRALRPSRDSFVKTFTMFGVSSTEHPTWLQTN